MWRLWLWVVFCGSLQAGWLLDLKMGAVEAGESGRELLVVVTSLKTSGVCVQWKKRVMDAEGVVDGLRDRFVLVHLDVGEEGNRELVKGMKVRGFPAAVFSDSQGRVYLREEGIVPGEVKDVVKDLLGKSEGFRSKQEEFVKVRGMEGEARVKALVKMLEGVDLLEYSEVYGEHLEFLKSIDVEDASGFQKKHRARVGFGVLEADLVKVFHKDSYEEVARLVDGYVKEFGPEGELLQKALFRKMAAYRHQGKMKEAAEVAREIIEVDAESAHGKMSRQILDGKF